MLNFLDHSSFNEEDFITTLSNKFMNNYLLEPKQATVIAMDVIDLLTENDIDLNYLKNYEY